MCSQAATLNLLEFVKDRHVCLKDKKINLLE